MQRKWRLWEYLFTTALQGDSQESHNNLPIIHTTTCTLTQYLNFQWKIERNGLLYREWCVSHQAKPWQMDMWEVWAVPTEPQDVSYPHALQGMRWRCPSHKKQELATKGSLCFERSKVDGAPTSAAVRLAFCSQPSKQDRAWDLKAAGELVKPLNKLVFKLTLTISPQFVSFECLGWEGLCILCIQLFYYQICFDFLCFALVGDDLMKNTKDSRSTEFVHT